MATCIWHAELERLIPRLETERDASQTEILNYFWFPAKRKNRFPLSDVQSWSRWPCANGVWNWSLGRDVGSYLDSFTGLARIAWSMIPVETARQLAAGSKIEGRLPSWLCWIALLYSQLKPQGHVSEWSESGGRIQKLVPDLFTASILAIRYVADGTVVDNHDGPPSSCIVESLAPLDNIQVQKVIKLPTKQRLAYFSYLYAENNCERTKTRLSDEAAHEWLRENAPEDLEVDKSFCNWSRSLRRARKPLGKQKKKPGSGVKTRSVAGQNEIESSRDEGHERKRKRQKSPEDALANLRELATTMHLEQSKTRRKKLWNKAREHLVTLGMSESEIDDIEKSNDIERMLQFVNEVEAKKEESGHK